MKKASYRRSFLWRFILYGLPIAAFLFMFWEVVNWEKPRQGPASADEGELSPAYRATTVILAVVAAIPYLGLLLRFSDRIILTDTAIQRRKFLTNRSLLWQDVIEYESFANYIHLSPAERSSGLYIDYPATFNRHRELTRTISRKCRESDVNMMGDRRRRRLVVCDLGVVPSAAFVVAAGVLMYFLRQRIVFLGVLSGIVLTLLSAWVWLVTRRPLERWKYGGFIYVTLFLLLLILPPANFAQGVAKQGWTVVVAFGLLYLIGLLAGSGAMSALLPNRRRR